MPSKNLRIKQPDQLATILQTMISLFHLSGERTTEELMQSGLRLLAESLSVDFVQCNMLRIGHLRVEYVWNREGFAAVFKGGNRIPAEMFPWTFDGIKKGVATYASSLDELPEAAKIDRRAFEMGKLQSLLTIPVQLATGDVYVLLMGSRQIRSGWSKEDLQLAKMSVAMMGTTLQREKTLKVLRESEEKYRNRHKQLAQTDKMATLGTLVSGIGHEINNPNNFILFNSSLLRKIYANKQGENKIPALLDGIREGSRRIKDIVANIKDYSLFDEGHLNQRVDVVSVLRKALSILDNRAIKTRAHLDIQLEENLYPVRGNSRRLEQVFINLLDNAIEFLPAGGGNISVSLKMAADHTSLELIILDDGAGIPPEDMGQIFDPFFTTRRDAGRTGLGLSIAKTIVEEHSGSLEILSEKGQGTEVCVLLPLEKKWEKFLEGS